MERLITSLEKIIPKEIHILQKRYRILNSIHLFSPIGRRSLSQKLALSEKIIRNETEFLREEGLIYVDGAGMQITQKGIELISELHDFIAHIDGLKLLEKQVLDIMNCKQLIIVPGDADENKDTTTYLGQAASKELLKHLKPNSILALTGGSTIKSVIDSLKTSTSSFPHVMIVPARGSIGDRIEIQANNLVAQLAEKLNAQYRLLNIPDNLSQESLESVSKEPEIQGVLNFIRQTQILLFGIGIADKMAMRRHLDGQVLDILSQEQAVGEVLGYYYNDKGDAIYHSRSIGIKLTDLPDSVYPIAVAGGASKAKAILAASHIIRNGSLILDEGAAKELLLLSTKQ